MWIFMLKKNEIHLNSTWDSRETHINWFYMSFRYQFVWGEIDVNFMWDSHEFKFMWNWCEWNLPVYIYIYVYSLEIQKIPSETLDIF